MQKDALLKGTSSAVVAIGLIVAASQALAHTRLSVPQINEGVRVENNVVVSHGCEGQNVIATTTVFPDGVDSTILVDGNPYEGSISDFINWGNLNQKILSRAVFTNEAEKYDESGTNVVGFWVRDGQSLPATYTAYFPFRTSAVVFEPASCAKSVKIVLGIADICKNTNIAGFTDLTVNLWMPAAGSDFDGPGLHGYNSPATLTVNRNLASNPLDASCGDGSAVELIPSAAQLNRDMPIKNKNGSTWWPKP